MNDEAALKLAEAIEKLAAAIEKATGIGSLGGGLHIYHHNPPPVGPAVPSPSWQFPLTGTPPFAW